MIHIYGPLGYILSFISTTIRHCVALGVGGPSLWRLPPAQIPQLRNIRRCFFPPPHSVLTIDTAWNPTCAPLGAQVWIQHQALRPTGLDYTIFRRLATMSKFHDER